MRSAASYFLALSFVIPVWLLRAIQEKVHIYIPEILRSLINNLHTIADSNMLRRYMVISDD